MKINYEYANPSMCVPEGDKTVLGLSPDLSREERVSFSGRLKNPLVFRDAMLMLREIVISDMSQKKKERVEFFAWLNQEIDRRVLDHEKYAPGVREEIQNKMNEQLDKLEQNELEILKLYDVKKQLKKEIDSLDVWKDYYKIERDFWKFIKERDLSLWIVLDPVITVHPDQVSFEAFSADESIYGCLSIDMNEFELLQKPELGTTNIDFSSKLSKEIERFRTYTNVELSINPSGVVVDTGIMPEHIEKKIDLPETWIKGFNQVSAAASLIGVDVELSPVDMYDICSFLRRHKAKTSPRYMKWILEPNQPVTIIFEPFGKQITLKAVYHGEKRREEKIWGRERWLIVEKIIPIAKSFKVRLLGFGMPQFIIADLTNMKMTIGFSSWSSNDWVKGTAFNVLAGFIGNGNYDEIYSLLKEKRFMSVEDIYNKFNSLSKSDNKAGIGMLLRKGEAYYDAISDLVRFRQLCSIPIPEKLYEPSDAENKVQQYMDEGLENFTLVQSKDGNLTAKQSFKMINSKYKNWRFRGTESYNREFDPTETELVIDKDGQILKVKCKCKEFNKGDRNISAPCAHILSLYINSSKFLKLNFKQEKEYKIKDIMEMLL
ncbi:MAG: hypothetical protein Q8900_09875 [Bacillota bacterium]|nr:hypothetical protein [Bacillota bacterium]